LLTPLWLVVELGTSARPLPRTRRFRRPSRELRLNSPLAGIAETVVVGWVGCVGGDIM
jgi:hypothetical protein